MKKTGKAALLGLSCAIIVSSGALNGCGGAPYTGRQIHSKMNKAHSPGKRIAIAHIHELLDLYDRHTSAIEIVDCILVADRNIPILEKLAEYAIVEGSCTLDYVRIARWAAKAPLADREFLRIAELVKNGKITHVRQLAKMAAEAQSEHELQAVRDTIFAREKELPLVDMNTWRLRQKAQEAEMEIKLQAHRDKMTISKKQSPEEMINNSPQSACLKKLDYQIQIAPTGEKREAIAHIWDLFTIYNRHYMTMDIADYILEADRNVPILARLAEYAITEGSATGAYIRIAAQAAKAPLADTEFLRLAELMSRNDQGSELPDLAVEAARAATDADVREVQKKIARLEKSRKYRK